MRSFGVLILLSFLFIPVLAFASSEDAYHHGNSHGSAGWDLDYGYDEELDGRLDGEKKEDSSAKKEAEKENKGSDDFFNKKVDVYEKDLSKLKENE